MVVLFIDVKIKFVILNILDLLLIYCFIILYDEKGKVINYYVLL